MARIVISANVFTETLERVRQAARAALSTHVDVSRVQIEPPRDRSHGDMATNAAMILAKDARKNPRELAEEIANILRTDDTINEAQIDEVNVAGPGFINLTLNPGVWTQELRRVINAGADYGRGTSAGHKVNVEYVSANPTGPMHVGHCRGAVFGDALANLLDFAGLDVTREYYINDAGAQVDDWEDREQTLFRASDFGDDVDRPLMKSDGSYTYFASDIAYHKSRFDRGFGDMIDVWGADHGGDIKRMQAAVKAVSDGRAALDVKIVQLVRLLRAGEPVKMSKRSGDFVTLREVVDEVGKDAVRFMMLYRKNDAVLDFDLAKV